MKMRQLHSFILFIPSLSKRFWEYDSGLARRWELDPAMVKYPSQSSYMVFNGNPLMFTDPLGNDPPESCETVPGAGGSSLIIPKSSQRSLYSEAGKSYSSGEVSCFDIGNKSFSATYGEDGAFAGYKDGDGNDYKNPDVQYYSQGAKGFAFAPSFLVNDVPADGLQFIQTCYATPRYDGKQVGFAEDINGVCFHQFVDGGVCSPYVTDQNYPPSHPYQPYYFPADELEHPTVGYQWNGTGGKISMYDVPTAPVKHYEIFFETTLIARNYMGSGLDLPLTTIKWGFREAKPLHKTGSCNLETTNKSQLFDYVIKRDYPQYKFFGK